MGTEGGTLRIPGDHRASQHGGRNVAQRLDSIEQALDAVATATDSATLAHIEHNRMVAEQLAAQQAQLDQLGAELSTVLAAVQGQALVIGQAVPPLLDATGLVAEAQRTGWRRAWRARRRAARGA